MKYSGPQGLRAFSNYIHATDESQIASIETLDDVAER
jgi:hypothetical protein